MQRSHVGVALAACCFGLCAPLPAQEPGPLATPTEKLDHLLSTWRGQTVTRVREVWGRENETDMRGTSPVLIYEKRVKVTAGLGGITMRPNGGLRCVVRFLISETEEVLRVARQGGGAECWNVWRQFEP
jgi:hypothetical protein